jgi:hypothetical protein
MMIRGNVMAACADGVIKLTRVSRLLSRLRKSASSGEVMRIVESFCTMTLAKSRS